MDKQTEGIVVSVKETMVVKNELETIKDRPVRWCDLPTHNQSQIYG